MAQLKDLLVSGLSRFIGDIFGNTLQITKILAPTASGGTTYGAGSSGNVLRSNSTSIYWGAPVTTNEVYANWSSTSAPDTDKQMNLTVNGSTAGTLKFVAGTGMVLTAAVGNPNTLTIGLGTTAWQAWVAGTTAGPQAKIKIGGTDYTSTAIPSASKTASGIVTTGTQEFKGRKVFGDLTRRGYNDSGNATRYIEDTYLLTNAGTAVAEYWYDIGDATNITTGKYYWRQYSPQSTAATTTTGYHETYSLPTVTKGMTANASYDILTSKNAVTIAQGGTGATTAAGARTNLQLDNYYLKLDGTNNMTADVNIITGDTDKYIDFWYNTSKTAEASWRIGYQGAGSSDTNYFAIQSGTSTTSATTWNTAVRFGMNTFDAGFSGNIYPITTASKSLGTSDLRWTNVYANYLYGTAKHTSAAHWSTMSGSLSGVLKVKIKKKSNWMLAFTLRVYQAYTFTDFYISGYNYGSNYWYYPQVVLGGSTRTDKYTVSFGYDNDAVNNYRTLWVSIPILQYTGADIFNVTNGYGLIDIWDDAFEIINETTSTGTVLTTIDAYRPWYRNEKVSSASYADSADSATTATTATKLGTATVGAADRPIYLSSGSPTQTTYRMAGTNVTATTALLIDNNLDTGIWYVNGTNSTNLYSQSDGAAYVNKYNDNWIAEIYQDYRTGQIAVRGKNNGTWQAWRKILDSTNYTDWTVTKTGTGASGSWGISITGSAGSVAWTNVTGKPDSFYTLPTATNTTLGGVKPWYSHTAASTGPTTGSNATAVAVNAISTTSGKYYAIESDSNGRLFVNVPWTDNNTTYPIDGKIIDANYATKYRTQTKGDTNSGWYISAIRNNTASVSMSPQYGAGLAWGNSDTHGYLYTQYSATSPRVYIGAGNADALLWRKELAMADGTDLSIAYGSSATAAGTAAKTVAITDFVLKTNSVVGVTFNTTSTANNPTLNINGTGAKAMYYRGTRIVYGGLATGFIYIFRYDGTNYLLLNYIVPELGTSTTAAGTAAKTVICPGFILYTGAIAFVKFNNTNTHATPTLNINSTGAKNIMYYKATTAHAYKIRNDMTYVFRYNGSQYELIGEYYLHGITRGVTAVAATYYTQQDYDDYVTANGSAPSWAVGDVKTPAVAEVVGTESFYLGNSTTSNTNNGMTGRLGLYGSASAYHLILSALTGSTSRTMYIPNYNGDGYFTHTANANAVGSTTLPVYVAANGRVTAITGAIANSTTGNAATASKLTDITTADAASSSTTWRRVWFAYSDNKTGRPAYDDNFAYQTSTGTLKVGKIQFGSTATYGSTTKPIYWNAGVPGECSTYAGGTAVTLNNSSKAASTASFYAPTSGGTLNTLALVGDGATAAPKWINISPSITITAGTGSATPKVNVTVLGQSGTAQSLTTASTSVYGCTMLSSATNSTSTTLAATPSAVKAAYDLANTASGYRYWANIESTSAAAYNKAPEMATIKLNGNTSASAASTSNVTLLYNSSIETLNFVFA